MTVVHCVGFRLCVGFGYAYLIEMQVTSKTTTNEFVIYMVLYMQAAWDEKILELVLQRLSDHTERCRELAIQLISDVACAITEVMQMLPTY